MRNIRKSHGRGVLCIVQIAHPKHQLPARIGRRVLDTGIDKIVGVLKRIGKVFNTIELLIDKFPINPRQQLAPRRQINRITGAQVPVQFRRVGQIRIPGDLKPRRGQQAAVELLDVIVQPAHVQIDLKTLGHQGVYFQFHAGQSHIGQIVGAGIDVTTGNKRGCRGNLHVVVEGVESRNIGPQPLVEEGILESDFPGIDKLRVKERQRVRQAAGETGRETAIAKAVGKSQVQVVIVAYVVAESDQLVDLAGGLHTAGRPQIGPVLKIDAGGKYLGVVRIAQTRGQMQPLGRAPGALRVQRHRFIVDRAAVAVKIEGGSGPGNAHRLHTAFFEIVHTRHRAQAPVQPVIAVL